MFNNILDVQKAHLQNISLKYIFFWGHNPKKKGLIDKSCLSQWYPADFNVNGLIYNSAEQWMMAKKAELFNDTDSLEQILNCKSAADAKKIGREIKGFMEEIWIKERFEIIVTGNFHKFNQNRELCDFLISTKDKILVEASPLDCIWGIGLASDDKRVENPLEWKGENLLGFALMSVREKLLS